MSKLLILGAGGHGKVIAEIAELSKKFNTISFLDDCNIGSNICGHTVIGTFNDYINLLNEFNYAFVAIGNNTVRLELTQKLISMGYKVPTLIHPQSIISRYSSIGIGTAIMAGAIVNPCCTIGKACIINTSSSVDHDCTIEDGVHISPGAHVCGTVNISCCAWVCTGSTIINNTNIGSNSIIAAGATVICDVPSNALVAGTPAEIKRIIKGCD